MLVFFDVETDSSFASHGDRACAMARMQITVACLTIVDDDGSVADRVFWRDVPGDLESMLACFDLAHCIVGYNTLDFDLPVLEKYYADKQRYRSHRLKSFDIFANIRTATGTWPSLDALLRENGLSTKISSGLAAIRMWERQERDDLSAYCLSDVHLTRALCELDRLMVRPYGELPRRLWKPPATKIW